MDKRIAKIIGTHLGGEDHGIFTAMVTVDYGDGGQQGIGGYSLDQYNKVKKTREGTRYGMQWIMAFMRACGVSRWEDLEGRTIFVLAKGESFSDKIVGVAPLPTEPGEPFMFDSLAKVEGY